MQTDRGDDFTADFIGLGTGPLHVPKLPGIPGLDTFKGHAFHTSRWDYAYTGGDASGAPLDRLADRRVAIIGTGATAVQWCRTWPAPARRCTCASARRRRWTCAPTHRSTPTGSRPSPRPAGSSAGCENFTDNQAGGGAAEDWVQDGWTDLARRIRAKVMQLPPAQRTPQGMLAAFEDADFEKMSEIRARVDALVHDADTAEKLKAWYRQLCKRPCFHDAYLQAFNQPRTHLLDTDGRGVERITERGVVVAGVEYEVDCIIYASGFEVGTRYTRRAGFDLTGRDGLTLSQAWADGMRSLHGVHVHGFPNAFFVQPAQGANLISNIPHNLVEPA
jgi:cation diffusion facilitator CzcD-associated flavoprotein CzcO